MNKQLLGIILAVIIIAAGIGGYTVLQVQQPSQQVQPTIPLGTLSQPIPSELEPFKLIRWKIDVASLPIFNYEFRVGPVLKIYYFKPAQKEFIIEDPAGDVPTSFIDIIRGSVLDNGTHLIVTIKLKELPKQLSFNQPNVLDSRLEYEWSLYIDVDGNPSTGVRSTGPKGEVYHMYKDISGSEIGISIMHCKGLGKFGTLPYETSIVEGTQHNTWLYNPENDTWKYGEKIEATVNYETAEITMIALKKIGKWQVSLESSNLHFRTFYTDGKRYEMDCAHYRISPVVRDRPPICVIKLQKSGVKINEVSVREFFDIYVGASTDDTGIKEVRFSSDDIQDGIPTGEWTQWYKWDVSSGDWDAETKIKKWSFATPGDKEVWAEVKDDVGQTAKCSANISARKLKDTIDNLFQIESSYKYPPYLLDLDSFRSVVTTIWLTFASWTTNTKLTQKYDEFYWTAVEYDSLSWQALIKARDLLENGNTVGAEKYLQKYFKYAGLREMSFDGAVKVFNGNLDAAEILAQGMRDGSESAVSLGMKFINPTAAQVADTIYFIVDYSVDRIIIGEEEAAKNVLKKFIVKTIFDEIRFKELDGRTISEWVKNREGKYLIPLLNKLIKSGECQWALLKVIKETTVKIGERSQKSHRSPSR